MTIADKQIKTLDTHSTSGLMTIGTATALSIAILCAQHVRHQGPTTGLSIVLNGTEETSSQLRSLEINDADVADQITKLYDKLLRSQKEIDPDTRRALYENLSDLYT